MRIPLLSLLSALLVVGCIPQKQYQALEVQHKRLQEQLAHERDELTQLQGVRYSLESQLQAKTREAAQAGQVERERLAQLMRRYDTLVAEHNQLADHYARLTALYDSTQRETSRVIDELQTRLGSTRRPAATPNRRSSARGRRRR